MEEFIKKFIEEKSLILRRDQQLEMLGGHQKKGINEILQNEIINTYLHTYMGNYLIEKLGVDSKQGVKDFIK